MKYLSVCSGLGGAELAFLPLGWECVGVSEVDAAASAVLKARFPHIPNLGDFTKIGVEDVGSVDLLVGGTPCQDFSVAGLRKGMDGDRGQLTIEFARLAERLRTRWVVWENVPGVLSIDEGRAFGTFLAILGKFGYGFAYRILDAQYLGVPQRRRRVFVVGYLGDWRCAAAVLFEQHSLQWYSPPRKEKGQGVARCLKGGSGERGWPDPSDGDGGGLVDVAGTLAGGSGERGWQHHDGAGAFVPFTPSSHGNYTEGTGTLRSNGGDLGGGSETLIQGRQASHAITAHQAKGGDPTTDNYVVTGGFLDEPQGFGGRQAVAFQSNAGRDFTCDEDCSPPLRVGSGLEIPSEPAIAFEPRYFTRDNKTGNAESCGDIVPALSADHSNGDSSPHVAVGFIHPRQLRNSGSSNQVGIKPYADICDALTR